MSDTKDRNETKKFLYDTELTTPHKVLGDNYDEQLRAVLNYAPTLKVRKIKGFNECPDGTRPKQ